MNLNTTMPKSLKPYFDQELKEYKRHLHAENLQAAWSWLFQSDYARHFGVTMPL